MSLGGPQIPIGLGSIEWSCHVCGTTRPDGEIGVAFREREIAPGVPMRENLRYCLVDIGCAEAADAWRAAAATAASWREPLP